MIWKENTIIFQFAVMYLGQTVLCETDCSNAAKQNGLKVIGMCNYQEVTGQEVALDTYDSAASGLESCKCDVISNAVSATFTVSDYEELIPGFPGCGSSVVFSITGATKYEESYECFGGDRSADSKYGDQVNFQWNRGSKSSNAKYCIRLHSTFSITIQWNRNLTKPVVITPEMTTFGVTPPSKATTTTVTATTFTTTPSTSLSTASSQGATTSPSLHQTEIATETSSFIINDSLSVTTKQSSSSVSYPPTSHEDYITTATSLLSQTYYKTDPKVIIYSGLAGAGAAVVVGIIFSVIAFVIIFKRVKGRQSGSPANYETYNPENRNNANVSHQYSDLNIAMDQHNENTTRNQTAANYQTTLQMETIERNNLTTNSNNEYEVI